MDLHISYTTLYDVWMGVCMTFVFVALVETVLVAYLQSWEKLRDSNWKNMLDIVSRILFPGVFFLFFICFVASV